MLVELTILGGALAAGRSLWRRIRPPRPAVVQRTPVDTELPRWIDAEVVAGTGAMALATAGALVRSSGLGLASIPLTLWSSRGQFGDAARSLLDEKRLSIDVIEVGATVVGFAIGAPIISAGSAVVHVVGNRLALRDEARIRLAGRTVSEPLPDEAWVVGAGVTIGVPTDQIPPGAALDVRPGRPVVADGVIIDGVARVDTGPLDGRIAPRELGPGQRILAGHRVLEGRVRMRSDATGEGTQRHRLATARTRPPDTLEGNAQRARRAADISVRFTAPTAVLAGIFSGPSSLLAILTGNLLSVYRVVGPVGLEAQISALRASGVRFTGPRVFERLGAVDHLCVDLSTLLDPDRLAFVDIFCATGHRPGLCLGWAAAVLGASETAFRAAVADEIHDSGRQVPLIEALRCWPDGVCTATVGGHALAVGPAEILRARGLRLDPDLGRRRPQDAGWASVSLAIDGHEAAVLRCEPVLRPGAATMLPELRRRGITPVLMSTERATVAERWARRLDVEQCWSELDEQSRVAVIEAMQANGGAIGYLGGGPLDLPSMAVADVALCMHSGDPAVRNAADVVLRGVPLSDCIGLFHAAHRHHRGQGQSIALLAGGTGALAFGTLAFGIGPIVTLGIQAAVFAGCIVLTLPDEPVLAALPEPGDPVPESAQGQPDDARVVSV